MKPRPRGRPRKNAVQREDRASMVLRLPVSLRKKVERASAERELSINEVVVQAVEQYFSAPPAMPQQHEQDPDARPLTAKQAKKAGIDCSQDVSPNSPIRVHMKEPTQPLGVGPFALNKKLQLTTKSSLDGRLFYSRQREIRGKKYVVVDCVWGAGRQTQVERLRICLDDIARIEVSETES